MSTINTSSLSSYLSLVSTTYSSAATTGSVQTSTNGDGDTSNSQDSATNITLSDAAKALLASASQTTSPAAAVTALSVAATTRAWFDEQYKKLGITEPTVDGELKVDLKSQSRASLVAVASNAQDLFSEAEQTAALGELQTRFDDAMTPYIAIARKTGNYGALYQAASDYLDQAGPEERATKSWQDAKKAIVDGLAAARAEPGKAPDTKNANDPIHALLARRSNTGSAGSSASSSTVTANARSMLDDQANAAADAGKMLVFRAGETGQLVDFTKFNNRTLAIMTLNTDGTFSEEESFAAKSELNTRTRNSMMGTLDSSSNSSGADMTLGLLRTYENMSEEEKQALGVTESVTDRLVQNFQTMQNLQGAFSSGGGLNMSTMGLSPLLNNSDGSQPDISMGLAGMI